MGRMAREVQFEAEGRIVPAYEVRPEGEGPFPGLVLIHEFWGLVPHTRDVADRFADRGYVVVAPDLYAGQGGPAPDVETARRRSGELADAQAIEQLRAAVAFVAQRPYVDRERVGTVGHCMGGRLALLLAEHEPALAAAVTYYGAPVNEKPSAAKPLSPIDGVERLEAPFLGIFGGQDPGIPVAGVLRLRAALEEAGKSHEIHIFPQAGHAFANDTRSSYHARSARQAWNITLEFLGRWLGA